MGSPFRSKMFNAHNVEIRTHIQIDEQISSLEKRECEQFVFGLAKLSMSEHTCSSLKQTIRSRLICLRVRACVCVMHVYLSSRFSSTRFSSTKLLLVVSDELTFLFFT